MYTTINMSLVTWDLETDPYDHTDLYNNWIAVDQHDHTPGKGAPLVPGSIPVLGQGNLGPCSVSSVQLCDGAVLTAKLASPAVQEVNIYPGAVTNNKIAANAVNTNQLIDGLVTTPKVADAAVNSAKLADVSVTNSKLVNGSVSEAKLANTAVSTGKLADQAVTSTKLGLASVGPYHIVQNGVIQYHIADDAVGVNELAIVPAAYVTIDHNHAVPTDDNFSLLQWDVDRYDNNNMWDRYATRSYITIQTAGIYLIEGGVLWEDGSSNAGVSGRASRIRKNNTPLTGAGPISPIRDGASTGPFRLRQSMTATIDCYVGDKIDMNVKQTSGSNQSVIPDGLNTHLAVTWIAPLPV